MHALAEDEQAALAPVGHAGEDATIQNILALADTMGVREAVTRIPLRLFYGYALPQTTERKPPSPQGVLF